MVIMKSMPLICNQAQKDWFWAEAGGWLCFDLGLRNENSLVLFNFIKRAFGSEIASAFLTKHRCNPFGKVKKQFSIHGTHDISASKTQEKKKQMNPASCALPAPFMLIN